LVAGSAELDACAGGGEGAAACSKGVVFDEPVGVAGWVVPALAGPPNFARRFARIFSASDIVESAMMCPAFLRE